MTDPLMAADALFAVVVVHCFACPEVVRDTSPYEAHDRMEAHYAAAHGTLIARLVGDAKR